MANERNYGPRKGWTPEEDEWARMSRNRDFGQPVDYDEAGRACSGPEGVCADYEQGAYGQRQRTWGEGRVFEERNEPGRFAGQGPRGYQRSDERIREEVCDRLMLHGYINADDIEVTVTNGLVTLMGTVDSRSTKHEAEDTASSVFGVKDVQNQLRVAGAAGNRAEAPGMGRAPSGQRDFTLGRERLAEGMEVVGSNGEYIGDIKEIRERDFLVNRSMARDIYVPFRAIAKSDRHVILNISADQVDDMNWERPPLMGGTQKGKNIWPA